MRSVVSGRRSLATSADIGGLDEDSIGGNIVVWLFVGMEMRLFVDVMMLVVDNEHVNMDSSMQWMPLAATPLSLPRFVLR